MSAPATAEAPARAAPPPEPFGFGPEESSELARRLIAHYSGRKTLPHWGRVIDNHRAKKAALYALLGDSGRLSWSPPAGELTAAERHSSFTAAMAAHGLGGYACYFSKESVAADAVFPGDSCVTYGGAKAGMALGRALAATLRKCYGEASLAATMRYYQSGQDLLGRWGKNHGGDESPSNEDVIPILVESVLLVARQGGPKFLALSANPLDVLTMSHSTFFVSCLSPQGQYRAGPQHYLNDSYSAVAYAYGDCRPRPELGGASLPYKVWRQLVHIDLEKGAAYFMKPYGNPVGATTHQSLRLKVAQLLARHAGQEAGDSDDWYQSAVKETSHANGYMTVPVQAPRGGLTLASIDHPTGLCAYTLVLKEGGSVRKLDLGWPLPCAACSEGTVTQSCRLLCNAHSHS